MNKAEILQALKSFTQAEKLEVIEAASHLLRQELMASQKLSLAAAVELMHPFYESGGELSQLTDQEPENFYEYTDYGLRI